MNKRIVVRTDASHKDGQGVAYAFVATAFHENGEEEQYEDTLYNPKQLKTTEAERMAMIFAFKEVYNIFKNSAEEFDILLENDCEGALLRVKEDIEDDMEQRVFNFYSEAFNSFKTRWISSEMMGKPHHMARETLRKGAEDE